MFFAKKGSVHILAGFVINEFVNFIFLSETTIKLLYVFGDPALEVICYAGIKKRIEVIGKNVDVILMFVHSTSYRARKVEYGIATSLRSSQ